MTDAQPSALEARQALHRCVTALDNAYYRGHRPDARGFTEDDAEWGANLARSTPENWTLGCAANARLMLFRYRAQLEKLEFPLDCIPVIPGEIEYLREQAKDAQPLEWLADKAGMAGEGDGQTAKTIAACEDDEKAVVVSFKFDPRLVKKIQSIPPDFRSPAEKLGGWKVWVDNEYAVKILRALIEDGFIADAKAVELIERKASEYNLDVGEGFDAEIFRASYAKETTFYPDGVKAGVHGYQCAGVEYAVRIAPHGRTIFGDEPGLGKSCEGICCVAHLDAFPCVVVCPNSVKINWCLEVAKWTDAFATMDADVAAERIHRGQTELRFPGQPNASKLFFVINYDRLKSMASFLISVKWKSVVFDEFHALKNRSQRSIMAEEIFHRTLNTPFRFMLSGTPVENRPKEIERPLKILGLFDEILGHKRTQFGLEKDAYEKPGHFNKILRSVCYVRRSKREVMSELPPVSRAQVTLEIDNRAEYDKASENLIRWIKTTAKPPLAFMESIAELDEAAQEKAIREKREKMVEGAEMCAHLVRINALKRLAAIGKLAGGVEWIKNFLDGSSEKLVLFAHHREIQEAFVNELSEYHPVSIKGGQDIEQRHAAITTFKDDARCRVAIVSLNAGGEGIDGLQHAASNVAIFEYGWNPAKMEQAESRLDRMGQRGSVNVWNLVGENTIDQDIIKLLDEKRPIVRAFNEGDTTIDLKTANIMDGLIHKLAEAKA